MRCVRSVAAALLVFVSISSFAQSSAAVHLVYKKKYVMGTVFEIAAYDRSSEHASNAIDTAFQEIVRLDDLLSNYKPESALTKLNRSAHYREERVPSDLYRVVEQSLRFSRLSEGKFDISVAP